MHNLKLWSSSNNINNINRFKESLKNKFKFESYTDLHKWSVKKKRRILERNMEIY